MKIFELASRLTNEFQALVDELEQFSKMVADTHAKSNNPTGELSDSLKDVIDSHSQNLLRSQPLLAGAGVVYSETLSSSFDDLFRWYMWYGDQIQRFSFVLDERSTQNYNYSALDWYRVPKYYRKAIIYGPYFDFTGVDEYIVTMASPIVVNDTFMGTTAFDVQVQSIQSYVQQLLEDTDARWVLTNQEGRIACSNSAEFLPGLKLEKLPSGSWSTSLDTNPPSFRLLLIPR